MIPGLGKEQISVGSAPGSDVLLQGPGVAPQHARIVKQNGQLFYVDGGAGPSTANGAPVAPGQPTPFDFRTQFVAGQTPVPLSHPAIAMMLMSAGTATAPRGHVIIGREAGRASLVIAHAAVSSLHATVMLDRMMVTDQGSTSGTYVAGQRIPPNQPTPLDPNGFLTFGPVPVPVAVLVQYAQAVAQQGGGAPVSMASPPAGAPASVVGPGAIPVAAPAADAGSAPRKHRTIIGELSLESLQSSVITIG